MKTPAVMFQGTGSHVGKSTIVAGLARLFARRGLAVRPFKPLNMSNNAAVTADGGEIGRAQALQARAAGITATVDMNPILLKPQADGRAQLVLRGRMMGAGSAAKPNPSLLPDVLQSFARVCQGADLVLVEGAGSPAELNLRAGDIANMGFATAAALPVILIGDIDRGGVIASLVGTVNVLAAADRARIQAFLVNKLHGEAALFAAGVQEIVARTQLPCLGVVPYCPTAEQLPAEDGVAFTGPRATSPRATGPRATSPRVTGPRVKTSTANRVPQSAAGIRIAVPQLPTIANFDDLDPLIAEPDVDVIIVPPGSALPGDAHLVILSGSKSTLADLQFVRGQGWDIDLVAHRRRGGHILGICGGYQMLGQRVVDQARTEGPSGEAAGLGLLDVVTTLEPVKILAPVDGHDEISDATIRGYEMHLGKSSGPDCVRPMLKVDGIDSGASSADGRVLGCYLHGLFAADGYRHAYLNRLQDRAPSGLEFDRSVDGALDALADHLAQFLDIAAILRIAGVAEPN